MLETAILHNAERQIKMFWDKGVNLSPYHEAALARVKRSMNKLQNTKYIQREDDEIILDPLNTLQNAFYLFYLANNAYKSGADAATCTMLYYLTKYCIATTGIIK